MHTSKIEWVLNPDNKTLGKIWNPITGCLNGCPYCYAHRLANGRLRERYLANTNLAPTIGEGITPYNTSRLIDSLDPFYPHFWEDRLHQPATGSRFKGVFTCDMSDLFGIGIPEEWTRKVLDEIKLNPYSRFYLLTKQPQNLAKFSPFPDNCWVGVSVTNEGITYPDMMEEACRSLARIEATVKYISFEPLLSSIYKLDLLKIWGINWVIIGAQTKPYKPPRIEWVEEIESSARRANIPIFEKNNLKPLLRRDLIQEMPVGG